MIPTISYTNNVGSYEFKRCLIDFGDRYAWNGSTPTHTRSLTIRGYINQGTDPITDAESYVGLRDGALDATGTTHAADFVTDGTLVLPWTTLLNMELQQFTVDDGVWLDSVAFTATFVDRTPSANRYSLHFFDLVLHMPKINLPVPDRDVVDSTIQMPAITSGTIGVTHTDSVSYGVLRNRSPYRMMPVELSGTVRLRDLDGLRDFQVIASDMLATEEVELRLHYLVDTLTQRRNTSAATATDPGGYLGDGLVGYPRVFDLADAIPELSLEMPIRKLLVASTVITLDVEHETAQVSISMLAQPQLWN
jgi:hypothetical protein